MSPSDLATLSLLDPDQGVCPDGHACRLSEPVGDRVCENGEYRGLALICWDITADAIEAAEQARANHVVVGQGRSFLAERASEPGH
jgi:hypothetical protein